MKKRMPTDKCGNFCFVNKVGGEYVFAREPIYIDKSDTDYYTSKLPTVFTFQEWEEILVDTCGNILFDKLRRIKRGK